MNAFAAAGEENSRAAQSTLTSFLNTFKSDAGKLIGLRDDRLVTRKTFFEQNIRRAVENYPKLGTAAAKVWDDVAAAYKKWTPYEKPYQILEAQAAPGSQLFVYARQTIRREAIEDAPAQPINDRIEIPMLTRYLEELKALGDKESPLKAILGGRTPKQAAEGWFSRRVCFAWPDCLSRRRSVCANSMRRLSDRSKPRQPKGRPVLLQAVRCSGLPERDIHAAA